MTENEKTFLYFSVGAIGALTLWHYWKVKAPLTTAIADVKSNATILQQTAAEKLKQATPASPLAKAPLTVADLTSEVSGLKNLMPTSEDVKKLGSSLNSTLENILPPTKTGNATNPANVAMSVDTLAMPTTASSGFANMSGGDTTSLAAACKCADKSVKEKTPMSYFNP